MIFPLITLAMFAVIIYFLWDLDKTQKEIIRRLYDIKYDIPEIVSKGPR